MDVLAIYLLTSAGLGAWLLARYQRRREVRMLLAGFDEDLDIALDVAKHEVRTRRHVLAPEHLLFGLLQVDAIAAAITSLDGDVTAIENRVIDALDAMKAPIDPREAQVPLVHARVIARNYGRATSCADLWARLIPTGVMNLLDPVAAVDVLFVLAHGGKTPSVHRSEPWVHVVLRNDDFTTRESVVEILRDIFDLDPAQAEAVMMETHNTGKAIAGRFPGAVAAMKIDAARARVRDRGQPLWIGTEPC